MNVENEIDILLVEDNPADAELAMRALKKRKVAARIVRCADGAEALDYLFARGDYGHRRVDARPRLVLLDLKLPKIDGLEVLRTIKCDPRTASIPVVMLTSSREEKDVVASYRLGANSYIVKPVDFDRFVTVVEELGSYWLLLNQPPNS